MTFRSLRSAGIAALWLLIPLLLLTLVALNEITVACQAIDQDALWLR